MTEWPIGGLIAKGGWMMGPILFGSVVALALTLERAWYFWRIREDVPGFADRVLSLVRGGSMGSAADLCSQTRHPLGPVFAAGLAHFREGAAEVDRVMDREGNRQVQRAERNLQFLAVVVGVEPLMGFLGTILGLIEAFMSWERYSTSVTVSQLAAGIYQAMITTASGLIVAIPYFVIYNIFLSKVSALSQEMNHYGDQLVSLAAKEAVQR